MNNIRALKSQLTFIFCIMTYLGFASTVEWNGVAYDDDTVASLITVIVSTNPIPSLPDTSYLYTSLGSICRIPALAKCKKIIVFDGLRPSFHGWTGHEHLSSRYEEYKQRIYNLTKNDPYFSNTELVFCTEWKKLVGALKEAFKKVTTPFVFIQQHDLYLTKGFDLNGLIATMVANPDIKMVEFFGGSNIGVSIADVQPDPQKGIFVPLCAVSLWSDQTHVATVDYYQNFVFPFPKCEFFMESVIDPALKKAVQEEGLAGHKPFGVFGYGGSLDGTYIIHTNGQHNNIFPQFELFSDLPEQEQIKE